MSEQPIVVPESEKGYQCEMVLDSVSPAGVRLVTMRWKYPLMVHAEACRHRCFSRSVASNRAIPTARIIAMVEQDPVVPVYWGRNQAGMAAEEELDGWERTRAEQEWDKARRAAVKACHGLLNCKLHKQIANRVLGPYQWVTEIVSGTDWANFIALRCNSGAQPEMRQIAEMARKTLEESTPQRLSLLDWHLPLVLPEEIEFPLHLRKKMSAARCARTSYRTHEGKVSTLEEDQKLYDRLVGADPKHASPCEHQACPIPQASRYFGNFRGWYQHRYELPNHTVRD